MSDNLVVVLALPVTVAVYGLARALQRRVGSPLLEPVFLATTALAAILLAGHLSVARYEEGAAPLGWLLAPATAALAVPLLREGRRFGGSARIYALAFGAGTAASLATALLVAKIGGLPAPIVHALLLKSVTAPVAIGLAPALGADPSLAAALAIASGITGALVATVALRRSGDPAAAGLGLGTVAHGIGTARAASLDTTAGAAATLAMGASALLAAVAAPLIGRFL